MKAVIKKYEIWLFLVLAPLTHTLISYAKSKGLITEFAYSNGRFYALLFLLLCFVLFTKGIYGVLDLFRPMLKWKVHPKWYLFSLFFAVTIGLITLLIKGLYLGHFATFDLYIPTFKNCVYFLSWAFLGEVVWISYAVRELSKTTNTFYASQIIGIFWTLWWLPSVFINIGIIENLPILPLFLNMMGAAGMCAVVYWKTKSGICVLILQYMLNMSIIMLPISPGEGVNTYITFGVLYFLVMLVFMYFMPPTINSTT